MSTVYIDHKGSYVRADSGVLIVDPQDGNRASRFPMALIERIVFRADTTLSTTTLCAIADAGIAVVALGGRTGNRVAQMVGGWHNNAQIRVAQVRALGNLHVATAFAEKIVAAKIKRQLRTIATISAARADLRKPFFDAQKTLEKCLVQTAHAPSTDSLRGLEGAAAAAYFPAYLSAFPPSWNVTRRLRRPPPDPINALLSLSYTLLYAIATKACWEAGLDPAVGALHGASHGRAALACDLIEPWRAEVDLWVWEQIKSRAIRAEHFGVDGAGGCLLGKAGRAYFYSAWAQNDQLFTKRLRRQARLCASALVAAAKSHELDAMQFDVWQSE